MNASKILDELLSLQKSYQDTLRTDVTVDRFEKFGNENSSILDEAIRETLIEHVGHLPIIASFLHPHLSNTSKVDLGRTLVILSVHDIGETQLGDIFTFNKKDDDNSEEGEVARKLLNDDLFNAYKDYEDQTTLESKFAKCVDKIAPKLHHLTHPETTKKLFEHYKFNAEVIKEKQLYLFEWDENLKKFFEEIIKRLARV